MTYKPYTLKEYNANIGKANYKQLGGLGPNMGAEQFQAKLKNEKRKEFDKNLKLLNKHNKLKIVKPIYKKNNEQ